MTDNRANRKLANTAFFAVCALSLTLSTTASAADLPADMQDRLKFGVRAYDAGENRSAFDTFFRLMSEGGQKFGASDGRMLRLYTNMGELYNKEKQFAYAEQCLKRGLNIAQKGFGDNSIQSVPALINLAQNYVDQGKDGLAQPLFKKALAIVDKPADTTLRPYVVVIETNLGSMYFAEGNYPAAEPHFKRAQQVATEALGAAHKWTITIGGMYAASLNAQGKTKEAKRAEQAAIAKSNEALSPVGAWNKQIAMADAAMAEKRYVDAESALKLALQAAQEIAAEPMLQALTLTRYAEVLLAQDKPMIAVEKLKTAQTIADSVLGSEDKAVLARAKQLADLERAHEQYADAEHLYLRVLKNVGKEFGTDSDQYAAALADLAGVYNGWAHYPQAVPYYTELLSLQEKKFGMDSDKLIPTLSALANAAQNNTQYFSKVNEKAEEHYNRAADIATKKFGKSSKGLAVILDSMSHYYQRRLDWDKATKTCAQVVSANEKNFGMDSPETVKALEHYAVVLRAAGMRDKAEPIESRIAKIKSTR